MLTPQRIVCFSSSGDAERAADDDTDEKGAAAAAAPSFASAIMSALSGSNVQVTSEREAPVPTYATKQEAPCRTNGESP